MSPSKSSASARSAHLGLGANLGDRRANLEEALRRLHRVAGVRVAAASGAYASAAVGLEGPEFLNAAARVETVLPPEELLAACLRIEAELGRVRGPAPASRPIDLDLLDYDGLARATPFLRLPHPRLTGRAFVLGPLAEIAPGLRVAGRTVAEWWAGAERAAARRVEGPPLWPTS